MQVRAYAAARLARRPRLPVPGQTTVTGTTEPLRILQARTRLVDND